MTEYEACRSWVTKRFLSFSEIRISNHALETCFSFPLWSFSADFRNVLDNTFVETFVRMTHECDEEIKKLMLEYKYRIYSFTFSHSSVLSPLSNSKKQSTRTAHNNQNKIHTSFTKTQRCLLPPNHLLLPLPRGSPRAPTSKSFALCTKQCSASTTRSPNTYTALGAASSPATQSRLKP